MWFVFSPDFLTAPFVLAEMQNDQPSYAVLDSIIVPLAYLQTALCLALWFPTKVVCWLYVLTISVITVLGAFAGPTALSAADSMLGYLQVLASGAMLATLYSGGCFNISSRTSSSNGSQETPLK